jgi:protein TonB
VQLVDLSPSTPSPAPPRQAPDLEPPDEPVPATAVEPEPVRPPQARTLPREEPEPVFALVDVRARRLPAPASGPPPRTPTRSEPPRPPSSPAADAATAHATPSQTTPDTGEQPAPSTEHPSPASQVVVAPVASPDNPAPTYPILARRRGWEGRVVLHVQVDARGRPGSVTVAVSSGHPVLDEAAVEAVSHWSFSPGTEDGRPVPGLAEIAIRFEFHDA